MDNFTQALFNLVIKALQQHNKEVIQAPAQKKPGKGKEGRLKICLLSTGPGKTLGDASLAEKLVSDYLNKFDVEIDTRLHLIEESQKDKTKNLFAHLDKEHPSQHNLIIESDNLGFDQNAFNPDEYDLIIPFAAYNLLEDDFKLKTQFFNDKPNLAFVKTEDAKALFKNEKFKQNYAKYNEEQGLITLVQENKNGKSNYYAYLKNDKNNELAINLTKKQSAILPQYFTNLDQNAFNVFDKKDKVCACDFDIAQTADGVRVLNSKNPPKENDKKKTFFNTAFKLQKLNKRIAADYLKPVQDKCVYLTRYDYYADDYLHSLSKDDVEHLGIDKNIKDEFKDVFKDANIQNFQAGFGRNKHGIMLPNAPEGVTIDSKEALKQNMENEDKNIVDLIYKDQTKQGYENNHDLYFGYHNIIPNTDVSALPIKDFVRTCLNVSEKKGKENRNIDFVMNIYPDNGDASDTCKISEVVKGIDLNKYDVEFWKKEGANIMEKKSTFGACDGKKPIVRLMNPFGMKNKSFLNLLRVAEPLTLQTGNSSIIEALHLGKVPLYQLTSWSTDFLNAFEQYTKDILGEEAYYTKIFSTANNPAIAQDEKVKIISDICANNQTSLQSEIAKLLAKIKEEKDLYKNFAVALKDQFKLPLPEKRNEEQKEVKTPQAKTEQKQHGKIPLRFSQDKRLLPFVAKPSFDFVKELNNLLVKRFKLH